MTTVQRITHRTITATDTRALAVLLSDAKDHLKVMWSEQDRQIERLIVAATEFCENWQGRRYIETQVADIWPCFPCRNLPLRWAPLVPTTGQDAPSADLFRTVTVAYYDADGASDSLALNTDFYLMQHAVPPYIYPVPQTFWPSTQVDRDDAVQVTYWAGSTATAGGAPMEAQQAILMIVGHWFRNPEAVLVGSISKEIEFSVRHVLGPKRLIPVG